MYLLLFVFVSIPEGHSADSQRSANAMLAAPYPPMPPYPILNPWQQQQLAMRPFQAYEPWSFPIFPATSKERSPSATLQDLTGADSKWEGYEKTEQMLKDIQVRLHLNVF